MYKCNSYGKKIEDYKPSPYFTWSVHLDGLKDEHDKAVLSGWGFLIVVFQQLKRQKS